MGRRYFCDYCQRSFVDDIDSRRKHLQGVSHIRMKKEYYAMTRDLRTLVKEERAKEPCRRFRNTGECSFDLLCNHTHYTAEELAHFERTYCLQEDEMFNLSYIDELLDKKSDSKSLKHAGFSNTQIDIQQLNKSSDPSLPPSLRWPLAEEISTAKIVDWG